MSIDKLKEMGFNLIPLKPKSKEPIGGLNWKQFQDNKYMGSYPDSCNVAVICGTSSGNIFVVDLDDAKLYDAFLLNTSPIQRHCTRARMPPAARNKITYASIFSHNTGRYYRNI